MSPQGLYLSIVLGDHDPPFHRPTFDLHSAVALARGLHRVVLEKVVVASICDSILSRNTRCAFRLGDAPRTFGFSMKAFNRETPAFAKATAWQARNDAKKY